MPRKLKFTDLFAGLGGFHFALSKLGHECVFASEIQPELQELYKTNHKIDCLGDINKVDIRKEIPNHDIICAGFPCQPFSQAGFQYGFEDEERGNFFYKIMEIIDFHKPEFVFLENVPNLQSHDNGKTFHIIYNTLSNDYDVAYEVLSPHYFGIPQHRTRIYIVGRKKTLGGLENFEFPDHTNKQECDIKSIIIEDDEDYLQLKEKTRNHFKVWQEFLDLTFEHEGKLPTHPIWAMEFGANYECDVSPYQSASKNKLIGKKGKFGELITPGTWDEIFNTLPLYANPIKSEKNKIFPDWKTQYIKQNRAFYDRNKTWIEDRIERNNLKSFENSHQKFEWNCGYEENPTLYNKIIQFRPSGISLHNKLAI